MTSHHYSRSNTNSDLGGGQHFNKVLVEGDDGGTSAQQTINLNGGATAISYGYTEPGIPGTEGDNGDFFIEVDIITAHANVDISAAVARVNSSGVQQAISAFSDVQSGSSGEIEFLLTNVDLGTWQSGDRLRVHYRFTNTNSMNARSVEIRHGNGGNEVLAPWGVEPVQIEPAQLVLGLQLDEPALTAVDPWGETAEFTGITDTFHVDGTVTSNELYRYQVAVAEDGVAITDYTDWVEAQAPEGDSVSVTPDQIDLALEIDETSLTAQVPTFNVVPEQLELGIELDATTISPLAPGFNAEPEQLTLGIELDEPSLTAQIPTFDVSPDQLALGLEVDTTEVSATLPSFDVTPQEVTLGIELESTDLTAQVPTFNVAPEQVTLGLEVDSTDLTQQHQLSTDDVGLGRLQIDGVSLTTAGTIGPSDVTLGIQLEAVNLTQSHTLQPSDLELGLELDTTDLSQHYTIAPESVQLGLEVDETSLSAEIPTFTVDPQGVELGLQLDSTDISQASSVQPVSVELGTIDLEATQLAQSHSLTADDIELGALVLPPVGVFISAESIVTRGMVIHVIEHSILSDAILEQDVLADPVAANVLIDKYHAEVEVDHA